MPATIDTQAINGSALTEFELAVPGNRPIPLDSSLVGHVSSMLRDTLADGAQHEHDFTTTSPEVVNQLLRSAATDGTPKLRFRLGYGDPDMRVWLPWQEHYIVNYSAIIEGLGDRSGHTMRVITADAHHPMNRVNHTAAYTGKISNTIAQIAGYYGLSAVIEETNYDTSLVQAYTTDTVFIRTRLQPRARNSSGMGNYVFYFRDGVLHFHTAAYQTEVKRVSYTSSTCDFLGQSDHTQQLWREGVAGSRLVLYDPYTGESREMLSDPGKALKYADGSYVLDGVGGYATIMKHLSTNTPDECEALNQSVYENARQQAFKVKASFDKVIQLRTGDLIDLSITQSASNVSSWAGVYLITGLVHTVSKGSLMSSFSLERGNITKSSQAVTVQGKDMQLVPETEAQGVDVNLLAAQQSGQTVDTSVNKNATGISVPVADANTVPT